MKITKLTIKNIGKLADVTLDINRPLILFYGEIKAGKSTILNAIRWSFGGAFPDDIIRHGEKNASVQLDGTDEGKPWFIRAEWYVGKDGTTKRRDIVFSRNGSKATRPTDEIARLLNPFLLDQDHLRRMNDLKRGRYLVELFGIDTEAEDRAIATAATEASKLRVKVDTYGHIPLEPIEPVNIDGLKRARAMVVKEVEEDRDEARAEKSAIIDTWEKQKQAVDTRNLAVRKANEVRSEKTAHINSLNRALADGSEKIKELRRQIQVIDDQRKADMQSIMECEAWLKENAEQPQEPYPQAPDTSALDARATAVADTSAIDAKIQQAGAQNVRAEQYQANKVRADQKAAEEARILELEAKQRTLKAAKVAKLAELAANSGIPTLVFKDDGGFEFDGTDAGMLSDSQIMRLSQALSGLYPEGFSISLLDRGESLGKSVMELNKDATDRESTILVSIVGERPARIPEHVGAYVVADGKVTT